MISTSLEWYEYITSKGGEQYLNSHEYKTCVHDSSWGCGCYKKHQRERRKFKNITKLLKWKVDLSNESTYGIVLIDINDQEQVYLALQSMKVRYKGSRKWWKLKLTPLKKILTGKANEALHEYKKLNDTKRTTNRISR
jgi:hypothetical protein